MPVYKERLSAGQPGSNAGAASIQARSADCQRHSREASRRGTPAAARFVANVGLLGFPSVGAVAQDPRHPQAQANRRVRLPAVERNERDRLGCLGLPDPLGGGEVNRIHSSQRETLRDGVTAAGPGLDQNRAPSDLLNPERQLVDSREGRDVLDEHDRVVAGSRRTAATSCGASGRCGAGEIHSATWPGDRTMIPHYRVFER